MSIAVITNECQRGAIGDVALWPALVESARPMIPALARLLDAARGSGLPVVHCVSIPRDAVAGVPPSSADHVLKNSLSLVATITTVDELIERLAREPPNAPSHGTPQIRRTNRALETRYVISHTKGLRSRTAFL